MKEAMARQMALEEAHAHALDTEQTLLLEMQASQRKQALRCSKVLLHAPKCTKLPLTCSNMH
eukprot:1289797-Pyramimonas_sp.AAC.2